MRFLAYVSQLVRDSAFTDGRFCPHAMHAFLNVLVPVILGVLLAGSIKVVRWVLSPHGKRNN